MKRTLQLIGLMTGTFMALSSAYAQPDYATPYAITTIAGTAGTLGAANGMNGAASFYYPAGVVVDTNDNVYLVDNFADNVRKISPAGGTNWNVTTLTGAQFDGPSGITFDRFGNFYVSDTDHYTICQLTPSVGNNNWAVTIIAGTQGIYGSNDGTNGAAQFEGPDGIAADAAGNLYVADANNQTIRKMVHTTGTNWVVTTIAGTPGTYGSNDGTNENAEFYYPSGIAVDAYTNIYVADAENNEIREITPMGTNWVTTTIGGQSYSPGLVDGTNTDAVFDYPNSITVDAGGNLYVADTGNNAIRKMSLVGTNWVTTTLAGAPDQSSGSTNGVGSGAAFNNPYGITVDISGNLFIADTLNNIVREGYLAATPNPAISLNGNVVTVSWPGPGGTLQTNSSLSTGAWGAYGGTVNSSNGTNSVTFSPAGTSLFFRLTN